VAVLAVQRQPAVTPLRLTLPGDVGSLAGLRASLRSWLADAGLESAEAFEITVACNEAAANAMEHSSTADGRVDLEVELVEGEILVRVWDRGRWRPDPPQPARGRGIRLMRSFMRTVDIRRGTEGTEVRMRRPVGWMAPPPGPDRATVEIG
jgi:anti-sigma regulatory factor (Ser/Thr protein kinase)